MCNFAEKFRGVLDPEIGIVLAKVHDVVGNHQHLFNFPQVDDVMSHSVQKMKPPCTDNVVHEDAVLFREGPEA